MKQTNNGRFQSPELVQQQNETLKRLQTKANLEPLLNQLLDISYKAQYQKR